MLYEALTGARPFDGDSYNAVIHNILTALPSAPCMLAPGMPPALESIVMKAMSRLPQQRFSSAREMRAALLSLPLVEEHAALTQAKLDLERRISSIPAAVRAEEPVLVEATEVGTAASGASLPRPRKPLTLKLVGVASIALVAFVVAAGWSRSSGSPPNTFHTAFSPKTRLATIRVETNAQLSSLKPKPFPPSSAVRQKPAKKQLNSAHPGGGPKTNDDAARGGRVRAVADSPLAGNSGAEIDPNYE
jgi:serine/threonine-protein kinase